MTDNEKAQKRRWMIGIAITVFFGLFGSVIAFLSYNERTESSPSPAGHGRGKSRNRD